MKKRVSKEEAPESAVDAGVPVEQQAAAELKPKAKPRAKKSAAAAEPEAAPAEVVAEVEAPVADKRKPAKKAVAKKAAAKKAVAKRAKPAEPVEPVEEEAAPEAPAEPEAIASEPSAETAVVEAAASKPRAKKSAKKSKGRDLVAEIPAEVEVAEVLPEQPVAAAEPAIESEEEPEEAPAREEHLERLQKVLAKAGIASRRAAEEMILAGRVQLNGKIVTELGTKADLGRDHIRVDGKLLQGPERLRYFVLNKPKGYVTTVSDPEGRPTVMQFFAGERERLYPVGRLDYLSEGLLLVTNDGELANKLTKAASGVEKTYLVKVAGVPGEELLDQLREGVVIERGRHGSNSGRVRTAPAQIRQVREGDNPWYEVILIEGRNRELRKMFEEIGHHVEKIRRVGYGPLVLDQEPGKMRELEAEEVHKLRLTAEGKLKPKKRRVPAPARLEREAGRPVRYGKEAGRKPPVRGRDFGQSAPMQAGRDLPAARDAASGLPTGKRMPAARPAGGFQVRGPQASGPRTGGFKAGGFKAGPPPSQGTRPPRETPRFTPKGPAAGRPIEIAPDSRGADLRGGPRAARGPVREGGQGFGGRSAQKPFKKPFVRQAERPAKSEKPARAGGFARRGPEEFGEGPIARTPGFKVEPVAEQPREPRSGGGFNRPAAAGKPFRPAAPRPDSGGERPFRKPQGATDRPAGRPAYKSTGRPAGGERGRRDFDRGASGEGGRGEFRRSGPGRPAAGQSGAGRAATGPTGRAPARFSPRTDGSPARSKRTFGDGEERPREYRPRTGGAPRPAPGGSKPFRAAKPSGAAKPEGAPKREESGGARVKNRWRNSFTGKNKGRPKPKPKKEA